MTLDKSSLGEKAPALRLMMYEPITRTNLIQAMLTPVIRVTDGFPE